VALFARHRSIEIKRVAAINNAQRGMMRAIENHDTRNATP